MNQLQSIPSPIKGQIATLVPYRIKASGNNAAVILHRLSRVAKTSIEHKIDLGRFRLSRSDGKMVSVGADIVLANDVLTVVAKAHSLRDNRKNWLKKLAFLGCWMLLLGAFLSLTGASQSLTQEWARRQGGANPQIIAEMAKSGERLTPMGISQSQQPLRPIDLVLADPTLLSSMFTSIAIIGALSAGIVRLIPESAWSVLGVSFGIPTLDELTSSAEEFQGEIVSCLKITG
ncbi:MAG: hypothetical protein LW720_10665 [Pirellula sp.]|jgi:hypothetical protein|nr:hypothetical protein [Pirellula sp.]